MNKEKEPNARKIEEWGKVKFKPTVRNTANPFTKPQNFTDFGDRESGSFNRGRGGFNRGRGGFRGGQNSRGGRGGGRFNGNRNGGGKFNKDKKDRIQFNAVARDAKPDTATPWTKFKDEINHKQREELHQASQANMDSEEAKNVLRQREVNYRRLLMEQKKNEAVEWEDFGESEKLQENKKKLKKNKKDKTQNINSLETVHCQDSNTKSRIKNKLKKSPAPESETVDKTPGDLQEEVSVLELPNKKKNKKSKQNEITPPKNTIDQELKNTKRKLNQCEQAENIDDDTNETKIIKKNKKSKQRDPLEAEHQTNGTKILKTLISADELKDFDPKNLNFHQKDVIRKILTKSVILEKGSTLQQRIKNRQNQFA